MQIWVDADACPGEIKELLFRAAKRTRIKVTLVANQPIRTPRSDFIDSLLVGAEMNAADRQIVELVEPGDLVITADIPLAADAVAKWEIDCAISYKVPMVGVDIRKNREGDIPAKLIGTMTRFGWEWIADYIDSL